MWFKINTYVGGLTVLHFWRNALNSIDNYRACTAVIFGVASAARSGGRGVIQEVAKNLTRFFQ
jgi:hypothetical protein